MPPLVLVMAGCERFAAGLPRGAAARLVVERFPNGELHARAPLDVAGRECLLVGSISPPPGNLERLTLAVHTLRRAGAAHIAAVLPYLAYARQDSAGTDQSLGLAWAGELLRAAGVQDIVCVDVHSEQARDILGLPVISLSPAAVLAGALPAGWRDGVTFVAPDEGAQTRATALARAAGSNRPLVWARKRRTRGGIEHLGLEGSPADRAVVVDDILDTGATLLSCCAQLRRAGAGEIAVVVTHGLFTEDRWRALSAEGVRAIWTTDTVVSRRRPPQTRIVSVAPLLAPVLGRGGTAMPTAEGRERTVSAGRSSPPAAPASGRS